jgi:tetratricopeptide (TPR) repeat protein
MSRPKRRTEAREKTSPLAKLALIVLGIGLLLLLLMVAELALSVIGYGPSHKLFLKKTLGGEEVYQLNREISQLFFPKWVDRPLAHEHFPVCKDPRAFRILATGASSTMGDPFGYQTAFPALLGEILTDVAPDRHYEIANCACIAISSLDVLLTHKEALKYEPDAILIYTGHNEVYGADGIDTPLQRSFSSRGAAKFWLWFRNLRVVRLLRNAISPGKPSEEVDPAQEGFGMWVMRDRMVSACSEKHERMLCFYRENILAMLESARRKGVDVILCTLISNVRDQCPMGSVHGCAFPKEGTPAAQQWQRSFDRGLQQMEQSEWARALEALQECNALDPEYAEVHFRMGRCLDALGDSAAAFVDYVAARDLDPVHFRACSAQNEVLREIARRWNTQGRHRLVLVDLDRLLYEEFPYGPGRQFFTEHVHPYPHGHGWIALAIARTLAESPLAADMGAWDLSRLEPPERYPARVGVSALDVAAGLILTDLHKLAKWPFTHCYDNDEARSRMQEQIQSLGTQLNPFEQQIFRGIEADQTGDYYDFGARHYSLYTQYRGARRGEEALRELRLARRYWPPLGFVEADMAQILVGMRRLDEAQRHLDRARRLDPDYAPIHFVAGALHHGRGRLSEAAREFQRYLEMEPDGTYAAAAQRGLSMLRAPARRP